MDSFAATYDFLAPSRIVFGWGRRAELGRVATSLGRRAFLVTGSRTLENSGSLAELFDILRASGVEPVHSASISHEPEVVDVDELAARLVLDHAGDSDLVIGIGGGSAIDLAKAAAAMATNRQSETVADYLEGVGRGLQIDAPPLPMIAMPTTAGTGSEATKNSVISSYDPPYKKSLRSDRMIPRVVLVDPELTVSVPPQITAHTGMDAVTQLIESYVSRRARPIPRALAIDGLRRALPALPEAARDGENRDAREAMSHAALLSGLALANSGLGLAHGVAAALGAVCRVSHGLACAVMLPAALRFNRSVCEHDLATLAEVVLDKSFETPAEAADAFIERIEQLVDILQIPTRLRDVGVQRTQLAELVAGSHGNSLAGNPCDVSDEQLKEILEAML